MREEMDQLSTQRSTLGIVKDIAADTRELARAEMELARTEIADAVMARIKMAGAFGAAGVFAFAGLLFFALAGAAALVAIMPFWMAALIVGGALTFAAGVAALVGMLNADAKPLVPHETVRTVKEDIGWARQQLKR
jgi:hypothetical protein